MPRIVRALLALALASPALMACKVEPSAEREIKERSAAREAARKRALQATCGSPATSDRLKQIVFDQAIRARETASRNLDTLSTHSLVRIENPVVESRDEALDVTVCTGNFILQIPPGAERGFGGDRTLEAPIEYAAQAAADGSGLVYRIKGVETIVARIASFNLAASSYRPAAQASAAAVDVPGAPAPVASPDRAPPTSSAPPPRSEPRPAAPAPSATPRAAARPAPVNTSTAVRTARTLPSFDCRRGRSRSEQMVCNSDSLAAMDREMSSEFYSALSNADAATRAELRRTRDRFLATRERCRDEACVAQTYRARVAEIEAIARD